MKIGFFIPNTKFHNVDCRFVDKGNPGIGGTWHVFLIVASQLAKRDNGLDVTVFVQEVNDNLPEGPSYIVSDSPEGSVQKADSLNLDYLVLNLSQFDWDHYNYSSIKSDLRLIVWCHNFVPYHKGLLDTFATQDRIARVINVGREQMELYLDHKAFRKMDYIYNCVPFDYESIMNMFIKPFKERKPIVTYIGSLIPAKSFHVLASIWKDILRKIPDAELYVIGSGKLYDESAKLGKYNIAEESYENKFISFLIDSSGNILPSVHFMGNMGIEKNKILAETKVGVPNPTGFTETFCISAVEMQIMGAVVTAMSAPGYYDTIINGCINCNKKELTDSIIRLLNSETPKVDFLRTLETINDRFSVDKVISDWESLFSRNCNDFIHPIFPLRNKFYHLKWVKAFVFKMSKRIRNPFRNIESIFFQFERIHKKVIGY